MALPIENKEYREKYGLAHDKTLERLAQWFDEKLQEKGQSAGLFAEVDEEKFKDAFVYAFLVKTGEAANALADRFEKKNQGYNRRQYVAWRNAIGDSAPGIEVVAPDFSDEFSLIALLDRIIKGEEVAFQPEGLIAKPWFYMRDAFKKSPLLDEICREHKRPGDEAAVKGTPLKPD